MAPPMHEIKRDGLVNMIKKDLHNLNLMLKGHELSPHRHGKPHPAAASRQDERVLIVDDFLTVRDSVEMGNASESVASGVDTINFEFVPPSLPLARGDQAGDRPDVQTPSRALAH